MITGHVNDRLEATIPIELPGMADRLLHQYTAIIDTGFDHYLMMRRADVLELGFLIEGTRPLVMANEQKHEFEYCYAAVYWSGDFEIVPALVSETECLVGARLLAGYYLTAAMVPGGRVTLTKLP